MAASFRLAQFVLWCARREINGSMGICSAGAIAALSERFGAEEKFHVELSTFRKSRAVSAGGKRSRLRKAYVATSSTAFPKLDPRARQSVTTAACAPDSAVRDAFTDRREPVPTENESLPKRATRQWQPRYFRGRVASTLCIRSVRK